MKCSRASGRAKARAARAATEATRAASTRGAWATSSSSTSRVPTSAIASCKAADSPRSATWAMPMASSRPSPSIAPRRTASSSSWAAPRSIPRASAARIRRHRASRSASRRLFTGVRSRERPTRKSGDRGLDERDGARFGIEPGARAHRERDLLGNVAERKSVGRGDAQARQVVLENLCEREGRLAVHGFAFLEDAERHARGPAEEAGLAKLREHPIDAIGRLPHFLEEKHVALDLGRVRRADHRAYRGEVAAHQPAFRAARSKHARRELRLARLARHVLGRRLEREATPRLHKVGPHVTDTDYRARRR